MDQDSLYSSKKEGKNSELDDQIDLDYIFKLLLKNKKFISLIILLGFFIGLVKSFITKPTWRGEFEIVLSNPNDSKRSMLGSAESILLSNLGDNAKSQLKTEVTVLKSPSVLMSIFEYVKNEKIDKGNKRYKNKRFRDWRDSSFDAVLERNTQVLKISYEDTDKKLVKPVLDLISTKYQKYSGESRSRTIELGIKYFEEQIEIFKNKSKISSLEADKFGLENALSASKTSFSSLPNSNRASDPFGDNLFRVNVESQRIESASQIRFLDDQLRKIRKIEENPEEVLGRLFSISEIDKSLGYELQKINSKLARMSVVYRNDDSLIKDLLKEKENYVELIKKQIIGFYSAQRESAKTIFASSKRDEEVLLKYKSLLSEAQKDAITLNGLENEYRLLLLEKSKTEDPWKLITNPTVFPEPVAPNYLKFSFIGLFSGILFSTAWVLFYKNRKKLVLTTRQLTNLLDYKEIATIDIKEKRYLDQTLDLISKNMFAGLKGNISFLIIGSIPEEIFVEIKSVFIKFFSDFNLNFTYDLRETINSENIILITALGLTNENDCIVSNKILKLQKNKVLGFLIIKLDN